ncbi:hypothetical protein ES332_A03G221100v1 [Gossypium tomentosum]|uniref:Auxin-responsive protein n=1 Tax=Gossypium tomentosum TaxID=34277 RepID=A0A5D2RD82_GOSTO|nr:hypothetical protein ES332_A03G221100v1 [Gossypium tomentosum]
MFFYRETRPGNMQNLMQTLQRNLRYPQWLQISDTFKDKEGEWLTAGDIPWHCWF